MSRYSFAIQVLLVGYFYHVYPATALWSGYGDTDYGFWVLDNSTQTAAFSFRGGACSDATAAALNKTCIPITNRTPIHVVGNDRHQLYVFSDGSASLRQDEGGPKMLNAYNTTIAQFAGAAGFVTSLGSDPSSLIASTVVETTVTPNSSAPLTIVLGTGFARRLAIPQVPDLGISGVDATLVAPFGDDSVVLSIVTVSGTPGTAASYTETWAATRTQFNTLGIQSPLEHHFSPVSAAGMGIVGLLDEPVPAAGSSVDRNRNLRDRSSTTKGFMSPASKPLSYASPPPPAPPPSINDPNPRASFFVCLSCYSSGVAVGSYSASRFEVYGTGSDGPALPNVSALAKGLSNSTSSTLEGSCLSALQVDMYHTGIGSFSPI